jgi:DNA-binding CsgD family transcriptional regulator
VNPNANQSLSLAARASSDPTPREKTVLQLLVQGKTNKQIGNALELQEFSARDVVKRLLRKFGFVSRVQFLNSELPPQWLVDQASFLQPSLQPSLQPNSQTSPSVNDSIGVIANSAQSVKNKQQ